MAKSPILITSKPVIHSLSIYNPDMKKPSNTKENLIYNDEEDEEEDDEDEEEEEDDEFDEIPSYPHYGGSGAYAYSN